MPLRYRVRAALRWVHRWIALTLGLVFTVVALSGSSLLFQPQFFRWAHGDLVPEDLPQEIGSIDRWVANSRAAAPDMPELIAIWAPHERQNITNAAMVVVAGREPSGFGKMGIDGVLLAPTTGEVLGVIDLDNSPAYAPIHFHRELWAGASGRVLTGVMAGGVMILIVLGVYLWWPPRGRLLKQLSPRPWRSTIGNALKLHNWTGIWAAATLMVSAFSGLYLLDPDWTEPALGLLPDERPGLEASGAPANVTCEGPAGFDALIDKARALAPGGIVTAIERGHHGSDTSYQVALATRDSHSVLSETRVNIDLTCGTVALEGSPRDRSARHAAQLWLLSLHDGSALGRVGELFITIMGLIPLVLLWSGVRMWARKRGWLKNPIASSGSQTGL